MTKGKFSLGYLSYKISSTIVDFCCARRGHPQNHSYCHCGLITYEED